MSIFNLLHITLSPTHSDHSDRLLSGKIREEVTPRGNPDQLRNEGVAGRAVVVGTGDGIESTG